MSRHLPPSITADATPDWLPAGWICHSTALKRGRQTRTYTNLRTGKKFSTKDQVLEYIKMEKIREKRESGIEKTKANLEAFQDRARPSWLPDGWKMEQRIGRYGGNQYTMYVNLSSGFKTNVKHEVLQYQNPLESESESESEASLEKVEETGTDYITYDYDMDEEDLSENEFVENVEDSSTPLRSQPERMQKLESRAKTQCVFEDEGMSSDSDKKLPEAGEGCNEANALEEAREIPGLTGSFSIEINLECEPENDNLVEKNSNISVTQGIGTRSIEIIDLESEEPLQAQEEIANEPRRSVFFPYREEAPSHSVFVFENSTDTIGIGLNPQEKNVGDSKKRKKNKETCSPKTTKKKDAEPPTEKPQKGKKRSSSAGAEEKPIEWPEPCPYFPFEPLTRTLQVEDDSVICKYLEEFAVAGSGDSALPDFGLPSFSNLKVSVDESEKKKSPDPPCVQVASSSVPTYYSMGTTTMQQTVAGN